MSEIEFKRFNRNVINTRLMLATTIISALVCILHFVKGNIGLAAIWFIVASMWFINFVWSNSTPFIEITSKDIAIYLAMARKPVIIPWTEIKGKQMGIRKVVLIKNNDKKIKIDLFGINKNDRKSFVDIIMQAIQ